MKPTTKQIELIKTIEKIVSSWRSTNDINSPTHDSDIDEELRKHDFDANTDDKGLVTYALSDILEIIRRNKYDRENKET